MNNNNARPDFSYPPVLEDFTLVKGKWLFQRHLIDNIKEDEVEKGQKSLKLENSACPSERRTCGA